MRFFDLDKVVEYVLLLDKGIIDPTILTPDAELQRRIQKQSLLEWKALDVRQHKRLS
ncbi:MAG: hypothetical protein AB9866_08780 [Syntrophobacteraceae bacterium]